MGCRIAFKKGFVLPVSSVQRKLMKMCPAVMMQLRAASPEWCLSAAGGVELSLPILEIPHHVDQAVIFFLPIYLCTSWAWPSPNAFITDCFRKGIFALFLSQQLRGCAGPLFLERDTGWAQVQGCSGGVCHCLFSF